ncbi:MAG: TPM domain-containing protein [Flavobacteriales bacterium]|nr:TPM domain-containing protein [Flavobacteriales bacterium]
MKRILLLLLLPLLFNAKNFPTKPSNYVSDLANVIDSDNEKELNKFLSNYEKKTSNQIFVYTTKSLEGEVMADLCQEIFHKWEIGQKGKNNGVLIAVFINDRKFRIHTGYGLEGVLPDVLTKRIQDTYMRPLFKKKKYGEGIFAGVEKLVISIGDEYQFDPSDLKYKKKEDTTFLIILYLIQFSILALIVLLANKKLKQKGSGRIAIIIISAILALVPYGGIVFIGFMLIYTLVKAFGGSGGSSGSRRYRSSSSYSSYNDDYSSSSSSSDYSSFDGGGGGDSGGGGSDSDW